MVENSTYKRSSLKHRIIRSGIIPYKCAICDQNSTWRGENLTLILDHINGVGNDHRKENLRFLCPNCNSQTPTFAGRNIDWSGTKNKCVDCNNIITRKALRCPKCNSINRRKIEWPDNLSDLVAESSKLAVAKSLGVSNVAVAKRLKYINQV